jgi:hypothetical protein
MSNIFSGGSMKKYYSIFIITLFCLMVIDAHAVLKLDIKTKMGDKRAFQVAKAGLIAYIKQNGDWAKVVEIKEDYSVWIKNFNKKFSKDSLIISLDLELHTPAMFTEGKLISKVHIIDTIDLANVSKDNTMEDKEMYSLVEKQLQKSGSLQAIAFKLSEGATNVMTAGIAGTFIKNGLSLFGIDMNGDYRADEALMGMAIGSKLFLSLKEMLTKK